MSRCELSLVLPVHEDSDNLNRILKELSTNNPDETWELIVVDDGSSTPLKLPENSPENWLIIHNEANRGAAISRNLGARNAKGTYLCMLSVFLKTPSDYIKKIKAFINNNEFDYAQHLIEKAPEITIDYFQAFLAGQKERLTGPDENLSIKQSLFTAAVIKTEIFIKLNGFDESMQHYGGHELDFVYRLDQAGFNKRIAIKEISLQRVKFEDHSILRKRLKEYGRVGLPNLLQKHPELKKMILVKSLLWSCFSFFGITRLMENILLKIVRADKKLSLFSYRLYLHLIVRNAWDAR